MLTVDIEVLKSAIEAFGINAQTEIIGEECLELATAQLKVRRKKTIKTMENLIDELADVFIVIHYGPLIYDKEAIQKRIDFKIERLKQRIAEHNQELE